MAPKGRIADLHGTKGLTSLCHNADLISRKSFDANQRWSNLSLPPFCQRLAKQHLSAAWFCGDCPLVALHPHEFAFWPVSGRASELTLGCLPQILRHQYVAEHWRGHCLV